MLATVAFLLISVFHRAGREVVLQELCIHSFIVTTERFWCHDEEGAGFV